ncbi:MAG: hypothetical protein EB015_09825 [Methylocystaceae bacterium]|nr:hypothetical protein [Methylocystaceae bacterium]
MSGIFMLRPLLKTKGTVPMPYLVKHISLGFIFSALVGCSTDRALQSVPYPVSYQERHPIALKNLPVTLDLHTTGDGLDFASQERLKDFATVYKERGRGPITMVLPKSQSIDTHSARIVNDVKRQLVAEGLRTNLNVSYASTSGGGSFAPIHFEFEGLTAQVLSQCGQWPSDLASAGSLEGLENRPYWNFGCSAQSNLANLVADPRDLVSPRGEAPNDVSTRTRTITSIRAGQDPATNWTVKNSSIGAAGG